LAWWRASSCILLSLLGCSRPFRSVEAVTLTSPLPVQKLVVHSRFGEVIAHADPGATEVKVEATKIGRGTSPTEAREALKQIQLRLGPQDGQTGTVVASAEHPDSSATREYQVEWRLSGPPDLAVEIRSDFGDVEARGFTGGLTVYSDFGRLRATAGGRIDLSSDFGNVELSLLPENPDDVRVRTDFGDVRLWLPASPQGRLVADTDFGSVNVHLEDMTYRPLRQRRHHVDLELGGAQEPEIDLATQFGDVTVRCK
jgi:hypothetical protein